MEKAEDENEIWKIVKGITNPKSENCSSWEVFSFFLPIYWWGLLLYFGPCYLSSHWYFLSSHWITLQPSHPLLLSRPPQLETIFIKVFWSFHKCFDVGLLGFSKIWLLFLQNFWQHWFVAIFRNSSYSKSGFNMKVH